MYDGPLSPMTLLGGGFVEVAGAGASTDGAAPEEQSVLALLRESGLEPLELHAIAFAANLREDVAADALARLVERGDAIALARPPAYVDTAAANALLARALEQLDVAHRDESWAMGLTSIALARALGVPEALLVRVLEHYAAEGRVMNRNGYYASVAHEPSFTPEQRAFFDHLVPVDESRPFAPIPFAGAAAAIKLSRLPGGSKAFDTMLARGALVKIGDDLYRGTQVAQIRTRVEAFLREHGRMTAAEFRDLLATTRKYAVPLLEWLDARGTTIRNGDYRTLRKKSSA